VISYAQVSRFGADAAEQRTALLAVLEAHQQLTELTAGGVTVAIGEDGYSPNQTVTGALLQGLGIADLHAGLGSGRTREASGRRHRPERR